MSKHTIATIIVLSGVLAASCTRQPPPPDREAASETALDRARTELSYACSGVSDVVGPSQEDDSFRYLVTAICSTPDDPAGEHEVRLALRYRYSSDGVWEVVAFERVGAEAP